MRLYHFTNRRNLRAIAKHGLTIGDVVTSNSTRPVRDLVH